MAWQASCLLRNISRLVLIDDVLLISTPKSGTTWLKALIFATMKRTCYTNSTHPLLTTNPHDCVPFFEFEPKSILDSGCKIVYLCRDPKDVLISMWYFLAKVRSKELPPLSLEETVDLFSRGIFGFGPFWDHVQGYWKASLECPERIFFITYEEMKRDTFVKVKRMAEFLGQPFSMEEETERVVEEIIELCSFGKLKNLEVNKNGSRNPSFKNDVFFRKGEVGDWRNHLTPQMVERLDQITNEKLPGLF
ncbi:hypothetical protein RHGRI_000647 [Rhododendron griersonianum]|uniref:Sulfotransferase n=1 Tax=Rhododendron griersonianum TaxID=479676 RepID=A0AAV6LHH9_9ERIC|nr:hypothetical protein RHGRI_000647 [Rhododendron griersonianum]